jgi:hypothetical protein
MDGRVAWKGLGVLAGIALVGCVGEAQVTYKGTVLAAEGDPGYSFDAEPNPDGLLPIAGATVGLCVTCDASPYAQMAVSAADGSWGPIAQVFGGFIGVDSEIRVTVQADRFETFTYNAVYENTKEPTNAEQNLNVRLRAAPR